MQPPFFSRNHTRTNFISLNTRTCEACWKCLESCQQKVLGKVDLPWHKHALIESPENCAGCLKCVKACSAGSLIRISAPDRQGKTSKKGTFRSFIVNISLLIVGFAMVLSGFIIQFNYHMGHHGDVAAAGQVWGLNYQGWSDFHKMAIVVISLLMVFHISMHWKWYKVVIQKNLIAKNKQTVTLTILFLLAVLTGYIPWLIHLCGGSEFTRKLFIEIHDKLTLFLFIYLVLHVIKRMKWFVNAYRRIRIG